MREILEWAEAKKPGIVKEFCQLPELILPSASVPYPDVARKLFGAFGQTRKYFVRDRMIVEIARGRVLEDDQPHDAFVQLTPAALRSRIDRGTITDPFPPDIP